MPRFILSACCLLLLATGAARAEDAKPLATFPMGPDRMPFVTLSFGGKDYGCLIQTVTSTTVLNEAVRPALGKAVGEQGGESLYILPTASLGPMRLPPESSVVCRDLSAVSRATGRPVDGIVGMDVLAGLGLTLDFDRSFLILHESTYRPSEPRESVNIACHPQPHVTAQVCGEEVILAIEVGNGMELSLPPALVEFYGSTGAVKVLSPVGVIKNSGGGPKARFGSIAAAGLNGLRHDRVLFFERSDKQRLGCLGNLFLARYNPTFLFASNEMLLTKSKWHDGHWWPGLRGMTLVERGERLIVFSVKPGSPAAAAGIGPDDQIDLPTDFRSCLELWRNNSPLNLHVRKPSTEGFTAVRVGVSATGETRVPVAEGVNTNATKPLASFSMGPDRMAWATVSFGGKDYRCILDTGSQDTAWTKSLKPELEVAARAIPGTEKYSMPELAIGSLQVPAGTIATCVDLEAVSDAAGSQIDGIIGMDVLASVALSLDFDQGMVTLYPASYRPEGQTHSAKMHCLPRPYTAVVVSGQVVLMTVDTGFDGELSLRADLAGPLCERGDAAILLPHRFATAYGMRTSRTGLLSQAGFGTCQHERMRFMEQSGEMFDGLIGMSFLGRYNVTFRFAQNELVFSRSKWHDAEWWPELCGMTMAEVGGRRLVFSVEPGSAAFRAGVRPDDEVQLPRDFLRRWSFGFSQHHSPFHLTWKNAPQYEDSLPIEWRKPIWPSRGPVSVRVRRPGAADFVMLQLDDSTSLNNVADDGVPHRQECPPSPAEVDAHINRWLEEEHVPGASIAVVKDGKVLLSKGYGLASIESLAQTSPQTEYEVVSLSQSLTALGVMLLVCDGQLSLDDKIGDRLPDLPETWRQVTVRHLLNKRSGIPSYTAVRDSGEAFSKGGPREAIAFVAHEPPKFRPGEQQGYSHTDYLLLALLIEQVSGLPYGEFVAQRILDPLGMSQTRLIDPDRDGDRLQSYFWRKKQRRNDLYDGRARLLYTFASNADDLVKLEGALSGDALFDQAFLKQMWSAIPPSTSVAGHGFGWQFGTVNGRRWAFPGGSDTGMSRFVDDNLTVIVLTNLFRADVEELSRNIAALFAPTLGTQPIDDREPATTVRLRSALTDLQRGTSDQADFNANALEQLPKLQATCATMATLGRLESFQLLYDVRTDFNTERTYKASFEHCPLMVTFWLDNNGKVDALSIHSVQ